jgi:hypothetical protein
MISKTSNYTNRYVYPGEKITSQVRNYIPKYEISYPCNFMYVTFYPQNREKQKSRLANPSPVPQSETTDINVATLKIRALSIYLSSILDTFAQISKVSKPGL